ncbi:hypothetical protein [Candidatus Korobacter versatilis]|nr:hypothetical protein [Candidatus Koribacter versatilis]
MFHKGRDVFTRLKYFLFESTFVIILALELWAFVKYVAQHL